MGIRDEIIRCMGDFPRRCDLDVEIVESVDLDGYRREKIVYSTSPGERVPAYVLTPSGLRAPAPGIVCIHQHGGNWEWGKSEVVGLADTGFPPMAVDLCKRGCVCIAPDQKCFEERRPPRELREEIVYLSDGWYERFEAMNLIQQGSTLQARYVWDLARAVDYLETLESIKPHRIGCLGHSLGGQEATYLLLYDRRVVAGVSICGLSTWEAIIRDNVSHNMAAYLPGLLKVCDTDEMVTALAPKPFQMLAGEDDDIFPIDGVQKIADAARAAYAEAGCAECFDLRTYPGRHFCDSVKCADAYDWLERWLR